MSMSDFEDNIKSELKKKYSLNREPHWYTECVKWAEKTREYIDKGVDSEGAGSKASEETLPVPKEGESVLVYKSQSQSIENLLQAILKK